MYWLLTILIIPYCYMLIRIWYGLKKIIPYFPGSKADIFISIIIPCRNEQKRLPSLLKDLSDQLYPPDKFEVIIVDDNSTDKTFDIAGRFNAITNLIILKNRGNGKKQAIRTGINASGGDYIITTDADCKPGKKWIFTIASFFLKNSPELIVCPVSLSRGMGFFAGMQELEFLSLQGVTAGTVAMGNPVMCNGANLAFTRETYNKHESSLHDETESGDDMFLLSSLKKEDEPRIFWLESIDSCVTTSASGDFRSFLKQRSRWFSKWKYYDDLYIVKLSIVIFVTNLLIACSLIAAIFRVEYLELSIVLLLVKSLPDYLILSNTAKRYSKKYLLKYFIPTQIIYPFYILSVAIASVIWNPKWKNT
jgi:biofilm PGA synthesis N-glycosyltransferase PgaC